MTYWQKTEASDLLNKVAEESEPDVNYQTNAWRVGDLVRQHGQLILIVAVGLERTHIAPDESGEWKPVSTYRELICLSAAGNSWQADGPIDRVDFLHNTSLQYNYRNREQLHRDYRNGFFTPYFEIL